MITPKWIKIRFFSLFIEMLQFVCFPLIVFQGRKVRAKALILPEAKGLRLGSRGSGHDLKLIILGDSSACGVGVEKIKFSLAGHLIESLKQEFSCTWKIVAKSGLTTRNLINLVKKEKNIEYDIALLAIGMNDITDGTSAEGWLKDIRKLSNILTQEFRVSNIIFSGMPPVRKLNQIPQPLRIILAVKAYIFEAYLQLICEKFENWHFINIDLPVTEETMAIDGFHPNSFFYKTWALRISRTIHQLYHEK